MASEPYPDHRRGVWRMKWRPEPNGKWETVILGKDPRLKGPRPPKSPTHEIQKLAAVFRDREFRAKHGLPGATTQGRGLKDYAEQYKATYTVNHDESTKVEMSRHLDRFVALCDSLNVSTLGDVQKTMCLAYLQKRGHEVSPNTLVKERGFIAAMFTRAVEEGLIAANPWTTTRVGKKGQKIGPKKQPTFWTPDEVARIIAKCNLEWHRDLVVVLVNTGIRISAVLAMEWGWVNLSSRTIDIPEEHNKGGHAYRVFIRDAAWDALRRRRSEQPGYRYVFQKPSGQPYAYDGTAKMIKGAVKRAKAPHGTPHDFRHTFGRQLHLDRVPQGVIQKMLGHAVPASTEVYTNIGEDDAVEFMRGLGSVGRPPGQPPESGLPPASPPS